MSTAATPAAPAALRAQARAGTWQEVTTGACAGYLQANMVILRAELAAEFAASCAANPRALPLVEQTEPGVPDRLRCAPGADLRTDLPRYHVHADGRLDAEVTSIEDWWRDDFVGFLLGCSFTAERMLLDAGVRLRHLELGQNVPMFGTSVDCEPAGRFRGRVVVSMRPIEAAAVERAVEVTARYPLAHGAPLHVGDPGEIGIDDLASPDWGDPMQLEGDEVPVFWACGVTPQSIIRTVQPEIAVTHAPGHMFVTDVPDDDLVDRASPLFT